MTPNTDAKPVAGKPEAATNAKPAAGNPAAKEEKPEK
jgi:hypothetical protein